MAALDAIPGENIQQYQSRIGYTPPVEPPKANIDSSALLTPPVELSDIQSRLEKNRQTYADSLKKSDAELSIENQLADVTKEANDYRLSLNQGEQAQFGLGRPLALSTGRAAQMEKNAAFTLQDYTNREKDLTTRLGIAVDARKLNSEAAKTEAGFSQDELDTALKIQDTIDRRNKEVLDYAATLDKNTRENFAKSLSFIQDNGIDVHTLTPQQKADMSKTFAAFGIDPSYGFKAAENIYNENMAKLLNAQRTANGKVDALTFKERALKYPNLPPELVGQSEEAIQSQLQSSTPPSWFRDIFLSDATNSGFDMRDIQAGKITPAYNAAWEAFRTQTLGDFRSSSKSVFTIPTDNLTSTESAIY